MQSLLRKAALTLGAAAAVIGLAAGNAVADPTIGNPAFTPLSTDIVGVGSDTTEYLVQALADG
jgi:ABC-type phosphate transport system substrate-binding protein